MTQQQSSQAKQRLFTASEIAEFEYCPLVWWHEQFEPLAQMDTEELFARMVELEHEHEQHATTLPEYQVIEQLLLRRGAFDEGQQQHFDHAEQVEEIEEEARITIRTTRKLRIMTIIIVVMLLFALLLIAAAVLVR